MKNIVCKFCGIRISQQRKTFCEVFRQNIMCCGKHECDKQGLRQMEPANDEEWQRDKDDWYKNISDYK